MREPIRATDTHIKVVVFLANKRGFSGWFSRKADLAFDNEFLWIKKSVIPLTSVVSVEDLGPGFLIRWRTPKGKLRESAFSCPTIKGFNRARRDQIVVALRSHIKKAMDNNAS